MAPALPAGWPRDLPPPEVAEFGARVPAWLLDRAPGDWRAYPVLRRHPLALANLVTHHLQAQLDGLRESYAAARRELGDVVPPDEFGELLAALEAQGALTAEQLRQVGLVAQALAGTRWRPRL